MDKDQLLIERIADRTQPPPSPGEVLDVLREKPYFSALAVAWLRRTAEEGMLYDAETRRQIALFASLASPGDMNRTAYVVTDLANGNETDENFYPPEEDVDSPDTEATIDRFLSAYSDPADTESDILEKLIFNPTPDYAAVLADEESRSLPDDGEAQPGSDDELINRYILEDKNKGSKGSERPMDSEQSVNPTPAESSNGRRPRVVPAGMSVEKPSPSADDSTFSESLAKIYLKRKNYSGAYEIINKLNLNYPEKSVYFAVQLRFLEKLLLNEQLKKSSTASTTKT